VTTTIADRLSIANLPKLPAVSLSHLADVGDPQPGGLWEIRSTVGTKKFNGVVWYWVDWEPTWILESELGRAREFIDEFKARHQE